MGHRANFVVIESGAAQAYFDKYFTDIAPNWHGWRLRYVDRGVDAFAEHLTRRGIESIDVQEASHPESTEQVEFQA